MSTKTKQYRKIGQPLPSGRLLERIKADYLQEGLSLYDLELKYNEGSGRIQRALKEAGVKMRTRAEQQKVTSQRKARDGRQFTHSSPGTRSIRAVPEKGMVGAQQGKLPGVK